MSPFAVVAVLLLSLLFFLLGVINVAFGGAEADSLESPAQPRTKAA
jgi:hypothetical protein